MIDGSVLQKLMPVTDEEQRFLNGEDTINRDIYMAPSHNVVNSKKLLQSGKLITVRPHTRFVHFPEHTHDYVEFIYMCSGSTTHIINGNTITLKEGELLFLSQGATQEILSAGEKDIAVNFIILPQFFDSTLRMMGEEDTPLKKFVVNCLKSSDDNTGYLYFKVADIVPVQNLVENLVWTLLYELPNKRKINEYTMGLLFVELLNFTDRLVYQNTEDEAIMNLFRYIEGHYRDGSLSEIAGLLHYDYAGFSKNIKNKTGKNYTQLVQEKRLSQACFLLKNTKMNISDIAYKLGYDNKSYFYRLFQKKYKQSPRQYRMHN